MPDPRIKELEEEIAKLQAALNIERYGVAVPQGLVPIKTVALCELGEALTALDKADIDEAQKQINFAADRLMASSI